MPYQELIVCFPFAMVAVCWLIATINATHCDDTNISTQDSTYAQVKKLEASRFMYFRKGGFWHRRSVVQHDELVLKVEERV